MSLLREHLGLRARLSEPLAGHTTWRVGGPALALCDVESAGEAALVLAAVQEAGLACLMLGRGSNLLVRDGGFKGVALRLAGSLARYEITPRGLRAGGGARMAALVKESGRAGLQGLEWAAGIPATLGGAVAMNAGALGGDMKNITRTVELLLSDGTRRKVSGDQIFRGYRQTSLPPGALVLGAELGLSPQDSNLVCKRIRGNLAKRQASQPLERATAGSVFKNPPGDYAARLIEEAGLKGLSRGKALVSPKHANFIETRPGACATEVLALIEEIRERVRLAFAVELELEIKVVGDA